MKQLYIILTFILGAIPFNSHEQTAGFYGKTHFVELNGLGNLRLFGLFLDGRDYERAYLKEKDGQLIKGRDLIDAGFRIGVGKAFSNSFGAGLEAGYYFQSIPGCSDLEYETSGSSDPAIIHHEMLKVRTFGFMPKLILTRSGGLIPIGLTHELGLGINTSKVLELDYAVSIENESVLSAAELERINDRFVDYSRSYGGMTLMYAMNLRAPLNRTILLNYGLRYTLNIWNYLRSYPESDSFFSGDQVARSIGRMRFSNFITLNAGITYSF